jgi:hypothetical protein
MKKKTAIIFFLAIFQHSFSQIEDLMVDPSTMDKRISFNKITATPEVTAFQKVNFLPINLYSGKPEINIPLYVVKSGDIEIPISLKYDIGENKVDGIATNVGWGWSLQAGGNITRIIRDIDDHEYDTSKEVTPCIDYGYCDDIDLQSKGLKLIRLGYLRRVNDKSYPWTDSFYTSNLNTDALPDLFLANAPGLSTKFYIERDFTSYDNNQLYEPKVIDGSLTKVEKLKYLNFKVDPIVNYSAFNPSDAAPNISLNPAPAFNFINIIRNSPGLLHLYNKDYDTFNAINEKGIRYKFSSFDINESTAVYYGDESFYNGQGNYGWPMNEHFAKSYKINKSTWHLDQIKDTNNREVNFFYSPVYSFEYEKTVNYTGFVEATNTEVNKITANLGLGVYFNFIAGLGLYNLYPITGANEFYQEFPTSVSTIYSNDSLFRSENLSKTTQQQLLDKITWDEGEVLFYYDLNRIDRINSKAITEIKVKNKVGAIVKHYKLNYSYFKSQDTECIANTVDDKCYRLRLDNVDDLSINNTKISGYSFEYDTNNIPRRYSNSKDFLGYYNGANNIVEKDQFGKEFYYTPKFTFSPNKGRLSILPFQNSILISNDYIKISGQADITPNSKSMNGLLKKIIHPTGGSTNLIYENNIFNINGYDIISGGARIKTQRLDDGKGNIIIKNYEYLSADGKSSGTILNFPKFADILFWNSNNKNLSFQTYSYDKTNIELTQGAYVGYNRVVEQIQGKGKAEYHFNSPKEFSNEYELPSTSFFAKHSFYPGRSYTDHDNRRGTLSHKYVYNDSGAKLLEENYSYDNYKVISTQNQNFTVAAIGKNSNGYYIPKKETFTVQILNSINRPSYKEVTEYLNGKALKTKTEYIYNSANHLYLTDQKTSDPSGDIFEKKYQYARDLRHGNQPGQQIPPYVFLPYMDAVANMIGVPIVTSNYKNGKFINRKQLIYGLDLNPSMNMILPKSELYYNEDKTQTISQGPNYPPIILPITSYGSVEMSYDKYDDRGNLLQYTTKDGLSTVIVWGYNQTQPIAKIEGAKLTDISQSLIDTIINASNNDDQQGTEVSEQSLITALDLFRNTSALSGYQIITYTYDPLIGVRSITPPSGIREVYLYDSANRLMEIREKDKTGNLLKEFKYNYKQ